MTKKSSYDYVSLKEDDLEGILPCPFCGDYDVEKQNVLAKVTDKHGWKRIECSGCGCSPNFAVYTYEEAIRLWNSRVVFSDSDEFQRGIEYYKRYLMDLINDME